MGSIGLRHLKNLKKIMSSFETASLRSTNRNISEEYYKLIDHEFYNFEDAKKFDPDVVFITNPTSLHVETTLQFMDNVDGIFIEKPLSDNIESAKKLVKNTDVIMHVACPLRFHPVIKFLKNYFNSTNKIKSIHITSGSYLPSWRPGQDYKKTYSARKDLGGGVSLDLIHEIDFMRWIFGDISEGYFGSAKISDLELDVEDTAYGIWKLKNGAVCEIHLDYYRKIPKREVEIVTENAVVHADLIRSKVKICEETGEEKTYHFNFDRNDMYLEEMNYFLDILANGVKSFNNTSFAIETLKYALYMRNNVGVVSQ